MNYDNLFGENYTKHNLFIEDKISCNLVKDDKDIIIGVALDFEYADDYHYKFLVAEWNKLMGCLFGTNIVENYIDELKEYFKKFSLSEFSDVLSINNIDYKKIAFY